MRDLEKSLAKAEERALELGDEATRLRDALDEARAGGGDSAELADELERLQQKFDRTRDDLNRESSRAAALERERERLGEALEAARSAGDGDRFEEVRDELDLVYQDLNSATRDWRTSIESLNDLLFEARDAAGDGASDKFDAITDLLSSMNDLSSNLKQSMRQMRTALHGDE